MTRIATARPEVARLPAKVVTWVIPDKDICREIFRRSRGVPNPTYRMNPDGSLELSWTPALPGLKSDGPIGFIPNRYQVGMPDSTFYQISRTVPFVKPAARAGARFALRRGASDVDQARWLDGWLSHLHKVRRQRGFSSEVHWSLKLMERKLPGRLNTPAGRHWVHQWLPALVLWTAPEIRRNPDDLVWQDVARRLESIRTLVLEGGDAELSAFVAALSENGETFPWQEHKQAALAAAQSLTVRFPEDAPYIDAIRRLVERSEGVIRKGMHARMESEPGFEGDIAAEESAILATLWGNLWPKVILEVLGPKAAEAGVRPIPAKWVWPRLPHRGAA